MGNQRENPCLMHLWEGAGKIRQNNNKGAMQWQIPHQCICNIFQTLRPLEASKIHMTSIWHWLHSLNVLSPLDSALLIAQDTWHFWLLGLLEILLDQCDIYSDPTHLQGHGQIKGHIIPHTCAKVKCMPCKNLVTFYCSVQAQQCFFALIDPMT